MLDSCNFSLIIFYSFLLFQNLNGDEALFLNIYSYKSPSLQSTSPTTLRLNRFKVSFKDNNGNSSYLNESNIYPLAVCNDGSAGGYYFAPALQDKDTWLIFLPGGAQCFDKESCDERWNTMGNTFMSSLGWTEERSESGILDTDPEKSPLWGANKAMLGYCSSDGYIGNINASNDTWGWHFRGQQLVFAMIQELIGNYGLSSTSTIIFYGGSAGARGVMALIDMMIENSLFPLNSKIIGLLDSPYYIDAPPYSSQFKGFAYQEQQKYALFNTSAVIPKACAEAYINEEWKCQFGQYRMPFVRTPYLLIASQYDSYQLSLNTQSSPPYTDASLMDYVNRFGDTTQRLIAELSNKTRSDKSCDMDVNGEISMRLSFGYFSWTCYNHDVSDNDNFSVAVTMGQVSQMTAFQTYLDTDPFLKIGSVISNDTDVNILRWIDSCNGFECGCSQA